MSIEQTQDLTTRRQLLIDGAMAFGGLALASLVTVKSSEAATPSDLDQNVIFANGQDPSAAMINGQVCYAAVSGNGDQIYVRQAPSIQALAQLASSAFTEQEMVWSYQPNDTSLAKLGNLANIWAPKIIEDSDGITIYASTFNGNINGNQRIFALQAAEIDDEFNLTGILNTGKLNGTTHKWAIDGSKFTFNGTDYFIWSGKEAPGGKVNQNLYISAMKNSTTLEGQPSLISVPEFNWEYANYKQGINEAPHAYVSATGQDMVIDYSANGSWGLNYCLGRLEFEGDDPLDPASYTKRPLPIFKSMGQIIAPGSHCTLQDESGTNWILYNNKTTSIPCWADRQVRAQTFGLDQLGLPVYGLPRSTFS